MRWAVALVLAGCSFRGQQEAGDAHADTRIVPGDLIGVDVGSGSGSDTSMLVCLGSGAFQVCVPPPTDPFVVMGASNTGIDTDTSDQCIYYPQPNGRPSLCVIAATTITIDQKALFFSGSLTVDSHPAVLFASDTIHIGNAVDVGSHQSGQGQGGGADSALCTTGSGVGASGGGAGGSFGSKGGNAGAGGGGTAQDTAGAIQVADVLRGGCRGDDGGAGPGAGGAGNLGGGALLLLAGTSITITGHINASGAGGNAGTHARGGGGGGGSGGMIAMDAPAIDVPGALLANGGGGAGGASAATDGHVGGDADPNNPTNATPGGADGGGASGAGASGAGGNTSAGNTSNQNDGAGGGGGGLGVIRILSGQTITGEASPVPTP